MFRGWRGRGGVVGQDGALRPLRCLHKGLPVSVVMPVQKNSAVVSGPDCGRSSPDSGETHGSVFRTLRMEEGLIVWNNGEEKETLKKNRSVRGHVLYSANVTFCADQLLPSAAFTGHISNLLVRRQFH